MLTRTQATYLDGQSAFPRNGFLVFDADSKSLFFYESTDSGEQFLFELDASKHFDLRRVAGEYWVEWRGKSNHTSEILKFDNLEFFRLLRDKFLGHKNPLWHFAALIWTESPIRYGVPLALVLMVVGVLAYVVFFHSYLLVPKKWDADITETLDDELKSMGEICHSPRVEENLQKILSSLREEDSAYQYKIRLIKSDVENAFALPGGQIVFLTKTLSNAKSYAEIAGIMAHEIGHVEHRHGIQQLSRYMSLRLILGLMFGMGDESLLIQGATDLGAVLLLLKYSRDHETEADEYGAERMMKTGISLAHLSQFFKRLQKSEGHAAYDQVPGFLLTHPQDADRINYFELFELKNEKIFKRNRARLPEEFIEMLYKKPILTGSCR